MSRKSVVVLAFALACWMIGGAVQAQTGGPVPIGSVHSVQRGETLFSIAQRYSSTVDAIARANGLSDAGRIYVGQQLVIPSGGDRTSRAATEPYVVQESDTLLTIARWCHTTWRALARFNGMLSPDVLHADQVIQVPMAGDSSDLVDIVEDVAHTVHADDTLLSIALRHGVSPLALTSANDIANPVLIYPGQALMIPETGSDPPPAPFVAVNVQPLPISQGKTMVIAVRTTRPVVVLKGWLFGRRVRFVEEEGVYYGLVGVHVFTRPGPYDLTLRTTDNEGQKTEISTEITVEAGRFGYERIQASPDLLDPAVIAAERERLNALRPTFTKDRRWSAPFQRPCEGAISSHFGTHRAYNDGPYTSFHSGVDLTAPRGRPVYAPAAGAVVLAEPLKVRGGAVVIDHGWGLLTGYWHLSEVEVQAGQQVAKGDLIGEVGGTGLSTGTHLHWELWVGGVSVDALQWLEEFYPWSN